MKHYWLLLLCGQLTAYCQIGAVDNASTTKTGQVIRANEPSGADTLKWLPLVSEADLGSPLSSVKAHLNAWLGTRATYGGDMWQSKLTESKWECWGWGGLHESIGPAAIHGITLVGEGDPAILTQVIFSHDNTVKDTGVTEYIASIMGQSTNVQSGDNVFKSKRYLVASISGEIHICYAAQYEKIIDKIERSRLLRGKNAIMKLAKDIGHPSFLPAENVMNISNIRELCANELGAPIQTFVYKTSMDEHSCDRYVYFDQMRGIGMLYTVFVDYGLYLTHRDAQDPTGMFRAPFLVFP